MTLSAGMAISRKNGVLRSTTIRSPGSNRRIRQALGRVHEVDIELLLPSGTLGSQHSDFIALGKLSRAAGSSDGFRNRGSRTDGEDLRPAHFSRNSYAQQRFHHELRVLLEFGQEVPHVRLGVGQGDACYLHGPING